jgi:acyl-[acyl-carrier-protein]-phospholipid O-acyltransferase/long-chain-fatty-acid--[acyl-carrier-protein] ligase
MWFLVSSVFWMIAHTIFRVRVVVKTNVPLRGPAVLASNHVTYADGVLIGACVPCPIRFLVWKPFFHVIGVSWILRWIKAIPVDDTRPRGIAYAIGRARKDLGDGHVVCIFPEGSITRTGDLLPFKRGIENIVQGLDVPIVPVHLHGLWGSIFSFERGNCWWKWPTRVPYPVTISFGTPILARSAGNDVRHAIEQLAAEASGTLKEDATSR